MGYDVNSGTLWVHPVSKLVEPEWDRCNIFENDIPQDHWFLGGVGSTPKIYQEGNSDTENINNRKMVTISYDVSNISDAAKKIDVNGILSRSNGTIFETMSSMDQHVVLEPCTTYKTIEWRFTPGMTGSYLFEITSDTGTSYGIGFTVKDYPDPPLKQFMSGIVIEEIECRDSLVLVAKNDGSPACVKEQTKERLIERGWIKDDMIVPTFDYIIKKHNVTFGSQYQISGGAVDEIIYDENSNSLVIALSESELGYLQIVIQTGVLHQLRQLPFDYFVLVDGKEVAFEQLSPIILKIPFEKGTKQIEIIGTNET